MDRRDFGENVSVRLLPISMMWHILSEQAEWPIYTSSLVEIGFLLSCKLNVVNFIILWVKTIR